MYRSIFKTESTKNIILSLISTIKSSRNTAKESSIKIFNKVTERLNQTQFKNIEFITNGNEMYSLIGDDKCSKRKDTHCNNVTLGTIFFLLGYSMCQWANLTPAYIETAPFF